MQRSIKVWDESWYLPLDQCRNGNFLGTASRQRGLTKKQLGKIKLLQVCVLSCPASLWPVRHKWNWGQGPYWNTCLNKCDWGGEEKVIHPRDHWQADNAVRSWKSSKNWVTLQAVEQPLQSECYWVLMWLRGCSLCLWGYLSIFGGFVVWTTHRGNDLFLLFLLHCFVQATKWNGNRIMEDHHVGVLINYFTAVLFEMHVVEISPSHPKFKDFQVFQRLQKYFHKLEMS